MNDIVLTNSWEIYANKYLYTVHLIPFPCEFYVGVGVQFKFKRY